MAKLIDEFRRGWQGISQPSPLFSIGFAASCLALSTAARWCLSLIRPDVFFTPYFPAVFFATAFGGFRIGIATALAGGALGVTVNFSDAPADFARLALLVIYLIVCGLTIWGVEHYRSIASQQRQISKRLIQEEEYRKLVVDELQHRLKNKLSTIHAVLHQVLQDQPQIWASIDPADPGAVGDRRSDRQGRRQRLRHQGSAALRTRTLRPCPIYPERQSAVSSRQTGGEPCLDISRACHQCRKIRRVFFRARAVAGVVVGVGRSPQHYLGRDRRSSVGAIGEAGFGTKLLKSALRPFDGKTEIAFLEDRRSLHDAMPHTRQIEALHAAVTMVRVDTLLMTIKATPIQTARLAPFF